VICHLADRDVRYFVRDGILVVEGIERGRIVKVKNGQNGVRVEFHILGMDSNPVATLYSVADVVRWLGCSGRLKEAQP
jgi:ATP-dependent exoDNAse (exonuclease V) alpha subunit